MARAGVWEGGCVGCAVRVGGKRVAPALSLPHLLGHSLRLFPHRMRSPNATIIAARPLKVLHGVMARREGVRHASPRRWRPAVGQCVARSNPSLEPSLFPSSAFCSRHLRLPSLPACAPIGKLPRVPLFALLHAGRWIASVDVLSIIEQLHLRRSGEGVGGDALVLLRAAAAGSVSQATARACC